MNKRQIQLTLLIILPPIFYILTGIFTNDYYLPINISYLILVVVFLLSDVEYFVHSGKLNEKWLNNYSQVQENFIFENIAVNSQSDGITTSPPTNLNNYVIISATPKTIVEEEKIYKAGKLKFMISETVIFISSLKLNLYKVIFFNIAIIIALMMITPVNNLGNEVEIQNQSNDIMKQSLFDHQLRLIISYFAVFLQITWFVCLLFFYRDRNQKIYTEV
jgi:hypothetical protein